MALAVSKAQGQLRGRAPKLTARQEVDALALLDGGDYTMAEVADIFGVSRRSTELVTAVQPAENALLMSLCPAPRDLVFDLAQKLGHDRGCQPDNQQIDPKKRQTTHNKNRDSQEQTLVLGPSNGFA